MAASPANLVVLNCGSTSIKYRAFDLAGGRAGEGGKVAFDEGGGAAGAAVEVTRRVGESTGGRPVAVGHRLVTGGAEFVQPTRLDGAVVGRLRALVPLDPLHLGPALDAVAAVRHALGGEQVGVFDTAFHADLPDAAKFYPIPRDLADRHGIRRFGAHGLAHRWMSERHAELTGRADARLVTLQLGGGCSACAVDGGRSVETSMGLTPLEGLMMQTRSGDVDPALASIVADAEGVAAGEIVGRLNRDSGLLGVSGTTGDVSKLIDRRDADPAANLAVEMYVHRLRKIVGAYLAVLRGADAICFGGGVGEHVPAVRAAVCDALAWCGVKLDPAANAAAVGVESRISADDSAVAVWVLPVDEEVLIARDAAALLGLLH